MLLSSDVELYRNTFCEINEDKDFCSCINEEIGIKISLTYSECIKRAKEITW